MKAEINSNPSIPVTPEIELEILESELSRVKHALRRKREELAPKFTLDDVFECDEGDVKGNAIKGVLAVAYLLDSIACTGTKPVDGSVAQGLSCALKHYADNIESYLKPKAQG
jgi:hypothetical protein